MEKICPSLFLFIFFFVPFFVLAQCTVSSGTPIVSETFGAGPNYGPQLPSGTTSNLSYTAANCPPDGYYCITNYTSGCWPYPDVAWFKVTDHTGNPNGYYMLVNASYLPSNFYIKNVTGLCEGTTYNFSAWIMNVCSNGGTQPNITFTIEKNDGTIIASYQSGNIPNSSLPTWKQYALSFTTPPGISNIVLRMRNNAPGGVGNDLALDDITFTPTGPPTSIGVQGYTGGNITVCTSSLQLYSTVGSCYSNNAYQWQSSADGINWADINGANASSYNAIGLSTGIYYFRLTVAQLGNIGNSNCRVNSNVLTVNVTKGNPLFISKQASICLGNVYILPSGKAVSVQGIYQDTVRYLATGCDSLITTLNLTVFQPQKASFDTTICKGSQFVMPSGKTLNAAGMYNDTLRSIAGCDSLIINVMLHLDTVPSLSAQSIAICKDSSVSIGLANGPFVYLWGTGATTPQITVSASGLYVLKLTDNIGCTATDTFKVTQAAPLVNLGKDTMLCLGSNITLDAGSGFLSYRWNTGAATQTISVTTPGKYWVTVKDANFCPASDSVLATGVQPPANFLPKDTSKCNYASVLLKPVGSYENYVWSTGETVSSISIKTAGNYWLVVTDANQCKGADSTIVTDSVCQEAIYVPNAFTPNGDGKNDVFRPVILGNATWYSFKIYDRWGQKIFETAELGKGWDGKINGYPQPAGVFIWYLSISLGQAAPTVKNGSFILMR